ncbi:MAG: hypothetical protein JXO51_08250 [Candidatus Aminicenantes bacterium]|nr:hypothetical protein [Candidatus Aminicenantes bacterium]
METLNVLSKFGQRRLDNFPQIQHNNLFKRIRENFHYELFLKGGHVLFSPFYIVLRGEAFPELAGFLSQNEPFLDSLKEFIVNTLFAYSAVIEENANYLFNDQDILIVRLRYREHGRFEVKLYSHYQEELQNAYNDKIYIGRVFVDLKKFEKDHLGLPEYFHSILEQNAKIQERARHKLRYYDEYKKPYLDEIDYLAKEVHSEAMGRIKLMPRNDMKSAPTVTLIESIDNLLHVQNLMVELKDFTKEFENKLRLGEETNYVKYLFKFSKDLINDIRYLSKLYTLFSNKISRFSLL